MEEKRQKMLQMESQRQLVTTTNDNVNTDQTVGGIDQQLLRVSVIYIHMYFLPSWLQLPPIHYPYATIISELFDLRVYILFFAILHYLAVYKFFSEINNL